jgi:hypothetical protein
MLASSPSRAESAAAPTRSFPTSSSTATCPPPSIGLTKRHLLTPGKLATVPFERTRFVSRRLSKGSRLVVVVEVNKSSSAQVNMGTGKDVSDESIADAGQPLQSRWSNQSFIQIPHN